MAKKESIKKSTYKVLFTGGHHNSAVAVIDELKKSRLNIKFSWVGQKYVSGSNELLPEYNEVIKRDVKYYKIKAGKIYRFKSFRYIFYTLYYLLLIPYGFIQAFFILRKDKPDVIASFGGFIAVPVVVVGKLIFKVPVLTHEQTAVLGLANSVTSKYADVICVSWPISNYEVDNSISKKMVYSGLPLRKPILDLVRNPNKYERLFSNNKTTIYITGGKLGALFLNRLIYEIFDDLTKDFNLIWQTGPNKSKYGYDFLNSFIKSKNVKDDTLILKPYFLEDEIANVFKTADMVISRGGAHTTYELGVLQKPSILIPIPWASNNEQYKNSVILEKIGISKVLDQESITFKDLLNEIIDMKNNLGNYKIKDKSIGFPLNASAFVANEIIKLIKS